MAASDVSCGGSDRTLSWHTSQPACTTPQGSTGENHFDPMKYRDLLSIAATEDLKYDWYLKCAVFVNHILDFEDIIRKKNLYHNFILIKS